MLNSVKKFRIFLRKNSTLSSNNKGFNGQWPRRVLSGVQPTGAIHIGNYFGAVEKWIKMQDDEDVILGIVDLHSITLPQDPTKLKSSIREMTAALLACGVDPKKCIIFQQSKVPQHAMLGWVLGTLTTMTRLYHFPQYKEKSSVLKDVPLGLFTYPVLQAADILLYKATHVPVGEDQVQHLNLAQHLVHTFNNKFGVTFPQPVCIVDDKYGSGRIRSLKEPDKKMSKSHVSTRSRIELTDSAEEIVRKVKRAVTDFTSEVTYDPIGRPGVANLIDIHCLATGKTREEVCNDSKGIDTGKYKSIVADALVSKFMPIRGEIFRILDSPDYIQNILEKGSESAREIAESTWNEVVQKVGLDSFVSDGQKVISVGQ
ncbi:tryptophan--tRNA ligase, mitochondrial isoform X2 [Cimex lectularius]|uniref:Tryptophan--tRNA ligase, mitochondrial n=1 Tax=Cimex lectularius TaxID=79782 RepID=A0A8I6SL15_CIMLE|nr:tryptophan--tRNA ligase, mitochondrial isoform X2 [Cimex lectularius]